MTSRALAWLLLTPWCLLGQLRLFLVEGQQERLIQASLDLGAVETGDRLEVACRVRNAGVTPVRLETLRVGGVGFGLAASLQLPKSLEPGGALDFGVYFEAQAPGNYSAILWLNSQSVLLRAVALPAARLSVEQATGRLVLTARTPVDFGIVELDLTSVRRFRLENPTTARLVVYVAVAGASFRGPVGLSSPVSLAPSEAAAFEVIFAPQQAGNQEGVLKVNQRTFGLVGTGLAPPFPKPQIFFDPPETASGRNVSLVIRLASPARAGGIGKVYLDFQPALPSLPDDPAIDFFISPGRFGWFSVLPGEEATWFGPRQDIWFQTGTTAGRITVTVSLGEHREQAVLDIPPAPIVIRSLTARRGNSSLEVSLWGIDNTRTGSQIVFSFFDAAGQLVAPGHISLNAAGAFRNYYESSVLGGTFALRAAFPVTGDASVLAGAEVEITNAAGVTRSERVPITP